MDFKRYTQSEIVRILGERFKDYRMMANLTQVELAEKAGVSRLTVRNFETGKARNITMGNLIGLLRAVDLLDGLDGLIPEIPVSPYLLSMRDERKRKRIRHTKYDEQ